MTDLFRTLGFNWLPSGLIDYFSLIKCLEVNKNTLIDYLGHLIDCIVLELFPDAGINSLIDYLDNLIDYFIELIDYAIDLIDYRQL